MVLKNVSYGGVHAVGYAPLSLSLTFFLDNASQSYKKKDKAIKNELSDEIAKNCH